MGFSPGRTDSSEEILVAIAGLVIFPYDAVTVTYPVATQEVYAFRQGGTGGTIVETVTVNYTDATKENLLNAFRT